MSAPAVADLRAIPGGLLAEQAWYYNRFAETYCEMFAAEPGETRIHGCETTTTFDRRRLKVGGAVDLVLTRPDGAAELRQFELWGGRLCADPVESWEMGMAVLRLRMANPDLGELAIRHVNLLSGEMDSCDLNVAEHAGRIARMLDEEVGELRSRASSPVTIPGRSCARCELACTCAEWADRPSARPIARDPGRVDYVGSVVRLTPTSMERWLSCPRAYRAAHLLDLPQGSPGVRSRQGLAVHACLARLHEAGSCSSEPDRLVEAASADGPIDETLLGFLTRHARRCPRDATSIGHELDLAQLHTWGEVPAMVTARVDAVWLHDGILDCRDYKTGMPRGERVVDDPAARVQAWLLARLATQHGARLRLRYEHLVIGLDDDPEPFEPDGDDIADIQREIGEVAAAIAASAFRGVSDPLVCGRCAFNRACPDSLLSDLDEMDDAGFIQPVAAAGPSA